MADPKGETEASCDDCGHGFESHLHGCHAAVGDLTCRCNRYVAPPRPRGQPACPTHGATARRDGSCMVRDCGNDRLDAAIVAVLPQVPLSALSPDVQESLEQLSRSVGGDA